MTGEPSGNWRDYPVISFVQPVGAGWYVTNIRHYGPGFNDSRHNLYVSTYNYQEWPNVGDGTAELHTPVSDIPVIFWASGEEVFDPAPAVNQVLRTWSEKPVSEPGCNFPIWAEQSCRVAVYDGAPSAVVSGITTALADESPDVTWGHHSWEVHFSYKNLEPVVVPPVVVIDTPTLEQIREWAWNGLYPAGVRFNPVAALPIAARERGLGVPVTAELDLGDTRLQGFALRILACTIGDWSRIREIDW